MLLEQFCHGFSLVKGCVMHWWLPRQIRGCQISAMIQENLRNGCLVCMSRGMQWRRSPMFVVIPRINIRSRFKQQRNDGRMSFPGGAMQRRRTIGIARIYQRWIQCQQRLTLSSWPFFAAEMISLPRSGISYCSEQ